MKTSQVGLQYRPPRVFIRSDEELDLDEYQRLLAEVERTIHSAKDAVRYQMNAFVIAVGSYIGSMTETAIEAGNRIGALKVDMGNTACEVPFRPRLHPKGESTGKHWEETQVCHVLKTVAVDDAKFEEGIVPLGFGSTVLIRPQFQDLNVNRPAKRSGVAARRSWKSG